MPSYRRLQQYAIAISVASVIYNGAEGGVSIGLGAGEGSRSLIFFGIQSVVEVLSAILVLWRFRKVAQPGEERSIVLSPDHLKFEKWGTLGIGILLLLLAISTEAASISALILHDIPDSSTPSLIVSSTALVLMILIWLPKRYLARALDSSVMRGEATCSLSCIQLTIVLFVGSLIFKVWKGGWWVDSATAIVLGLFFAWEGVKMVRWARSSEFTGGCCEGCLHPATRTNACVEGAELGQVYRDICSCCATKEDCRRGDECKCSHELGSAIDCCVPVRESGEKCCTRQVVSSTGVPALLTPQAEVNRDTPAEPQTPVIQPQPSHARCCENC